MAKAPVFTTSDLEVQHGSGWKPGHRAPGGNCGWFGQLDGVADEDQVSSAECMGSHPCDDHPCR